MSKKNYVNREKLRELIDTSGRTLQDIADAADIDRPRISELLNGTNGNPRLEMIFKIAGALGVWPGLLVADRSHEPASVAA